MAPVNPATGGQAFGLWLLTDGRVLSHGSALNKWVILTPDAKGSYVHGTWKNAASKTHGRGGATQAILNDGRFLEIGGEYVDGPACTPALCVSGEIYDPVADKWTDITPAPLDVGDTGTAVLDDGRFIASTRKGKQIQIYDPKTDSWTMSGTMPLNNGQENSWSAMPNGGILAVGYAKDGAAILDTATMKWQRTGPVPSGWDTGDTGGITLMYDGRVFVYGFGVSYIYTPGPTGADPGTWKLGPMLLNGDRAEDEYSNIMPNGKVWGGLVEKTYGPGVILQEFDPETDTVRSVTPAPDKGNPYPIDYCNLPNGQVMITAERNDWIYTLEAGDGPKDEWRPTVTSVSYNASDKSYTLKGTQLSGWVNGADEGDDMTMAQNYPIVSLQTDDGDVYYARTFNFSHRMPHKGSMEQTCQFTVPESLPEGTYDLFVSAVGVRSKTAVQFKTGDGGMGTPPATNTGTGGSTATSGTGGSGAGSGGSGSASGTGGSGGGTKTGTGGVSSSTVSNAGSKAGSAGIFSAVGTGGSGAVASETGGSGSSDTGSGAPKDDKKSGCGCRVTQATLPPAWMALAVIALMAVRLRRRFG